MRLFKMLGLAVVSALAAMAFMGAGTASADTICENKDIHDEVGTCPVGNRVAENTPILGLTIAGAPATLLAGIFEVKCHSTALGLVGANENPLGHKGIWGLIDLLKFENCSGSCMTADGLNEPYLLLGFALKLHALVTKHAGGGEPEALLTGCALGDCKYRLTALPSLILVVGDVLQADEVPLTRTEGLCPATGKWDASYLLTLEPPNQTVPLYLVSLP